MNNRVVYSFNYACSTHYLMMCSMNACMRELIQTINYSWRHFLTCPVQFRLLWTYISTFCNIFRVGYSLMYSELLLIAVVDNLISVKSTIHILTQSVVWRIEIERWRLGGERGRESLRANSCPNILHADLYSLHPCCYWYHYAGCSCCEEGAGTCNGEVMEPQALMRSDTGSRSAKHPPDFNGSRSFPVSALDQRSLPANQNTWMYGLFFLFLWSQC